MSQQQEMREKMILQVIWNNALDDARLLSLHKQNLNFTH